MTHTYRQFIVLTLILGTSFLAVALRDTLQNGPGLLTLLQGRLTAPASSQTHDTPSTPSFTLRPQPILNNKDVPQLTLLNNEISKITRKVSPSIISIHANSNSAPTRNNNPTQPEGSGVIVTTQGHIITNYHVVKDHRDLTIQLHDGTLKKALLIGKDPQLDIAMLQIQGGGEYPALHFGRLSTQSSAAT